MTNAFKKGQLVDVWCYDIVNGRFESQQAPGLIIEELPPDAWGFMNVCVLVEGVVRIVSRGYLNEIEN